MLNQSNTHGGMIVVCINEQDRECQSAVILGSSRNPNLLGSLTLEGVVPQLHNCGRSIVVWQVSSKMASSLYGEMYQLCG